MLFFVVALALIAASTAAPIVDVEEINALIDITIQTVQKQGNLVIPGFEKASLSGLQSLRRDGSCVKIATFRADNAVRYECKAVADGVVFAEGESMKVSVHLSFEVVINGLGKLESVSVDKVEVTPEDSTEFYSFWSKVKSALGKVVKDIEKTAAEALKSAVHQKVDAVVTSVVTGLLAG